MRITESKIKHLPNCVCAFCWLENHIKLAKSNGRILARLEQVKRRTSETETETETCADELGILWSILNVCVCLVAVRHEQLVVPMCYFCLVPVHKQSVPLNLQLAGVCTYICLICAILII